MRLEVLPIGYNKREIGGIDHTGKRLFQDYFERQERERLKKFCHLGYSFNQQEYHFKEKMRRVDELKLKYKDSVVEYSSDFKKTLDILLSTRRIMGVENPCGKVLIGTKLSEQFVTEKVDKRDGEDVSFSFLISSCYPF